MGLCGAPDIIPPMASEAETLHRIPLVRHLSPDQREEVLQAGGIRALAKGEILFHEEDDAESLFGMMSGRVKLVRYSPRGKEMLLHLVGPGQSFAEAALFGKGTYPATAVAVENCRVWALPRRRIMDLIQTDPALGLAMLASVSMWTRKLASNLELLTQRRVEERLAVYLLGRGASAELSDGDLIALAEPKHLIAAQCGTAPEVLSRTLRRLEEDGVLEGDHSGLRILDVERLRALAEWIDG